jgi:hypothetical protein
MKCIEEKKLRICELCLREDGVLRIYIKAGEIFNLDDAKELIAAGKELGRGKPVRNLIVLGEHATADPEAREYAATKEAAKYRRADAFVIKSLAQRIVANFYLKFNKPFTPTKVFSSEDCAEAWLMHFSQ